MRIDIQTIPHAEQRYPTVGDWTEAVAFPDGEKTWTIHVSDLNDWRREVLVAVHELVEMSLCVHRHIAEQDVSDFDVKFEAARTEGNTDEPGDDPKAPYCGEHQFATKVEKLLAVELEVDWEDYERAVMELP